MTKIWNAASGDWNVASNWTPSGAPGASDAVVIDPQPTVYGSGATLAATNVVVGSLTLKPGFDTLAVSGTFHAATIVNQAGDSVLFSTAATLNGFTYDLGEAIAPFLDEGATLGSAGALTLGANLHLAVGAFQLPLGSAANAQAGSAFLYSRTVLTNNGTITANHVAAAGAPATPVRLVIDQNSAGASNASATFINNGTLAGSGLVAIDVAAPTVQNNGQISLAGPSTLTEQSSTFRQGAAGQVTVGAGAGLTWTTNTDVSGGGLHVLGGGTMRIQGFSRPHSGAAVALETSVHLVNDGTIAVGDNATLRAGSVTASAGLSGTVTLGNGSMLELTGGANAETLEFTGSRGVLQIDAGAPASGYVVGATIAGFGSGGTTFADVIDLKAVQANGAHWSEGTLALTENNVGVAKLHLAGNFASASFLVSADGTGGTQVSLASLAPSAMQAAFASTSPVSATGSGFAAPLQPSAAASALYNPHVVAAVPVLTNHPTG